MFLAKELGVYDSKEMRIFTYNEHWGFSKKEFIAVIDTVREEDGWC